ncbi:hypothetical protein HGD87_05275 [Rhodobacteraceae bacterium R_SAG9]|nr:hypothetical protein [Rhodobacteraceae bacterium R_SAG9]
MKTEVRIPIGIEAAARELAGLSPEAQSLLMGMIALTSTSGKQEMIIEDAVDHAGLRRAVGTIALAELIRTGVMHPDHATGRLRLHRLYSGIAQGIAKFANGQTTDGGGGELIAFPVSVEAG